MISILRGLHRHPSLWCALCIVCVVSPLDSAAGWNPGALDPRVPVRQDSEIELQLGLPVVRELQGGQAHAFKIMLSTDQYVHVVLQQHGIDVVVALFGPDHNKLAEVDSPNGELGPEELSWVAETTGAYRLEVRSTDKNAPSARYEAGITQLRQAGAEDKPRVLGEKVFRSAQLYEVRGSLEEASNSYLQALALWRAARARKEEADTYSKLGQIAHYQGSLRTALDYFGKALSIRREIGDRRNETKVLNNIGVVYDLLGERAKALEYYNQSLVLSDGTEDLAGRVATLNNIGAVYDSLGAKQRALDYYNQALLIIHRAGDRSGEGTALNNIGRVYDSLGEKRKAVDYFHQALTIMREVKNRGGEATALNNIGRVHDSVGEKRKALDYFNQALMLIREVRHRGDEAAALNNIGGVYDDLGEKARALEYYNQALQLFRAVGDRISEADTLSSIGHLYNALGEVQKALAYLSEGLSIVRQIGDRAREAAELNNVGTVYDSLGDRQKALKCFEEALSMTRQVGSLSKQAAILNNIGWLYFSLGENQKALDYLSRALGIRRQALDRAGEATTLSNIGRVYHSLGLERKAIEYYEQSLPIMRQVGDRSGEAATLRGLAEAERDLGEVTKALSAIRAAIDIIEYLRTEVASPLRLSYSAGIQDYYSVYIDLLMQFNNGHPTPENVRAALETSERSRARSLLEMLRESQANVRRGVDPGLLDLERSLRTSLAAKSEQLARLLIGAHTDLQVAVLRKEIDDLTFQYQDVQSRIRDASPRYAALTQPQPVSVNQLQDELEPDTLLLEYSLGSDRSYLWEVSKSSISGYKLPKRAEIEANARSFYAALRNPLPTARNRSGNRWSDKARKRNLAELGTRLSTILLGPVASKLLGKRLVIVADGALQYIPFGALPAPKAAGKLTGRPLILQHEVVNLPSASVIQMQRRELAGRPQPSKTVIVLADPVFSRDDARVPKPTERLGVPTLGRLPYTRKEAEQIAALAPSGSARLALDFSASRTTATSGELSKYRYVHFATHGLLDTAHPDLSAIVLSLVDERGSDVDGFLRTNDIFNLDMPAEMVVLSASQTGLGKEVKGEGLVGMTRACMYAGAKRVVVSLWCVDDHATEALMAKVYRGILKEGKTPAAALRQAQNEIQQQKSWNDPYYWAGFVLQGEWR